MISSLGKPNGEAEGQYYGILTGREKDTNREGGQYYEILQFGLVGQRSFAVQLRHKKTRPCFE